MNRRDMMMSMAGTAVIFTLDGCQVGFTRSFRFRMTVEVMTLQGLRTGSAVYEIYAAPYYDPTLSQVETATGGLRGQATIVDLPDGPLFVLATGNRNIQLDDTFEDIAFKTLADWWGDKIVTEKYIDAVSRLSRDHVKVELPKSVPISRYSELHTWPAMVRFADMNDLNSVQKVDPDIIGVERIWLETTRERVTANVDKRFPHFLENFKTMKLVRRRTSGGSNFVSRDTSFVDRVAASDFSAEFKG